jgi:hypothetical protein
MDRNIKDPLTTIAYQKDVILCLEVQLQALRSAISMLVQAMDNDRRLADVNKPEGYMDHE